MHFNEYFSATAVIKILCKYRIKHAKAGHKTHMLRDISLHPKSLLLFKSRKSAPPELEDLFPSRRNWIRPSLALRKKINNTEAIRFASLYNTVMFTHLQVTNMGIVPPVWYVKLQNFITIIQNRANNPSQRYLQTPVINPIKKENSRSCKVCRPISLYDLEDRILIGFTAKYLTDIFDPFLHNCSYAFRSTKISPIKTHHDTVEQILNYQKQRKGKAIYAAEADLEKFFDTINHDVIKNTLHGFVEKVKLSGREVDTNATSIFMQYLASYTFNKDVFVKNDTDYFSAFNIPNGRFEWPLEKLKKLYSDLDVESIGVPQGGALSCLIANMVLHDVDNEVDGKPRDSELLYLRFCDDMVILHTNQRECTNALNRYEKAVVSMKLLMHTPEFIMGYGSDFWKMKSKRPYYWSPAGLSQDSVPWLGFVGYQIRYDGIIRVRKKSLQKEAAKQKEEMLEVLKALNLTKNTQHEINDNSRKSKRQQVFALENRLISMSVGRVKLYNYNTEKRSLCWTSGFKCINMNSVSKSQCRYLDRNRAQTLKSFKRSLAGLVKKSENKDDDVQKIYFGHPFSYHGFLQ